MPSPVSVAMRFAVVVVVTSALVACSTENPNLPKPGDFDGFDLNDLFDRNDPLEGIDLPDGVDPVDFLEGLDREPPAPGDVIATIQQSFASVTADATRQIAEGDTYTFEATVVHTGFRPSTGLQGIVVAEKPGAWHGIVVTGADAVFGAGFAVGRRVRVEGKHQEFFANTQIRAAKIEDLGEGAPIAPTRVTPEAYAADPESWEGTLVELADVTVGADVNDTNNRWRGFEATGWSAATGGALVVGTGYFNFDKPAPGARIERVAGVVVWSFDRYRAQPRNAADIAAAPPADADPEADAPDGDPADTTGDRDDADRPDGEIEPPPPGRTIEAIQSSDLSRNASATVQFANGERYTFEAIVSHWTGVSTSSGFGTMAVAEAPGPRRGIIVSVPQAAAQGLTIARGALVRVTGEHQEFFGNTQIRASALEVLGAGEPYDASPLTPEAYAADPESWEGTLVTLAPFAAGARNADTNDRFRGFEARGYSGAPLGTLLVGNGWFNFPEPRPDTPFSRATGVIVTSFERYRVQPRDAADLPPPPEGEGDAADAVDIEPDAVEPDETDADPADADADGEATDLDEAEAVDWEAVPVVTIAQIQRSDASRSPPVSPDGRAVPIGKVRIEEAVVSSPAVPGAGLRGLVAAQGTGPDSGVLVVWSQNAPADRIPSGLTPGDRIVVWGEHQEFFGNTQIFADTIVRSGSSIAPEPVPLNVLAGVIVDDESWEGSFVSISNAAVGAAVSEGGTPPAYRGFEVAIQAQAGTNLIVGNAWYAFTAPTQGTAYASISGVVQWSFNRRRLFVRGEGDFQLARR